VLNPCGCKRSGADTDLPICALRQRTERTHRTSPDERRHARPIGTFGLVSARRRLFKRAMCKGYEDSDGAVRGAARVLRYRLRRTPSRCDRSETRTDRRFWRSYEGGSTRRSVRFTATRSRSPSVVATREEEPSSLQAGNRGGHRLFDTANIMGKQPSPRSQWSRVARFCDARTNPAATAFGCVARL
jgi:hypothetical protein